MEKILVINAGSSSFKFKVFSFPKEDVIAEGMADRVGLKDSSFEIKLADKTKHSEEIEIPDQTTAVKILLDNLKKHQVIDDPKEIIGIGHRIVAGGETFKKSTLINKDNLQKIYDLTEYAPLHDKAEADVIKAFLELLPNVPEVAVFDTAFHQSLDPVHYLYSLPYKYYEKYKARKYGAHGTSVRFLIQEASKLLNKPLDQLKLIVCHLGSGASITAVKNGKSLDTSMGFSPLAGITMSTRSGDVDPSLLAYIMKKENIDMDQMIDILNHKSGLLGISEISPDMRDLRDDMSCLNDDQKEKANLARNIFINRICRYIGAYIVEMGDVDGIIFTAGVGEHDFGVRAKVMDALNFMGIVPDEDKNKANEAGLITRPDSKIAVMLMPYQ
ncbi:acetate kinase [Lactobacillus crispatus]|uniref:Acetate kinase n=1 Tax=Lactobacillus crispatus TaxID=47770 RepID=A0AAW4DNB6_9LACO|nr:acetate kinase [Lactobacillus crispatus]